MKSVEFNFQLKQCGLYKVPPFQVRWGNIKLFYNGHIVCTQKTIWIHVACQASFGIFNKRGNRSFLQRRHPKETSALYPLSPLLLPKCQKTISAPLVIEMPGTWHVSPLVHLSKLRWLWIGPLSSEFSSAKMCWDPIKCSALFQTPGRYLERWVRPHLDLSALSIS